MVPIFPFHHVPFAQDGLAVRSRSGLLSIEAHYMSSYALAITGSSWAGLRAASAAAAGEDLLRSIDTWLERVEANTIPGSTLGLYLLNKAIWAVLELAKRTLGITLIAGVTLIDGLAWMLMRATALATEVGKTVLRLLESAMRFLGRTMVAGAELTAQFISYVLGLLMRPLAAKAYIALERAHRSS
jgi:hypothetical protein